MGGQAHFEHQKQGGQAGLARLTQRIDDLSEHIELQLANRGVADAHGPRMLISRQPIERPLVEPTLTIDLDESAERLWGGGWRLSGWMPRQRERHALYTVDLELGGRARAGTDDRRIEHEAVGPPQ